jgi:hypothetical protein
VVSEHPQTAFQKHTCATELSWVVPRRSVSIFELKSSIPLESAALRISYRT